MGFLSHNSGSRYARRSIEDSKDADDHLVSKYILSQKNGSFDWCPGPGKFGQKHKNMPSLPPTENPEPKTKNFFQSQLEDLLNP